MGVAVGARRSGALSSEPACMQDVFAYTLSINFSKQQCLVHMIIDLFIIYPRRHASVCSKFHENALLNMLVHDFCEELRVVVGAGFGCLRVLFLWSCCNCLLMLPSTIAATSI